MRGNLDSASVSSGQSRSIPAYAGEPAAPPANGADIRVYPRVCGGTRQCISSISLLSGLSPRMRGNLFPPRKPRLRQGSIPAYAGEPCRGQDGHCDCGVYPRVCGGTARWYCPHQSCAGLSPRMRGNRQGASKKPHSRGSIPAYAGEPIIVDRPQQAYKVYPRVCGGTSPSPSSISVSAGLSPRMRGNLNVSPGKV